MKHDQMNNLHPVVALAPLAAAIADNTPQASAIIDTKGYHSITFLVATGILADVDATFAVTMTEGDDPALADGTAVGADDLIGTVALAGFTFAADGVCRKIGYRGIKRYVRLTITPTNNASAAPLTVIALMGEPDLLPTPNPPA